jgi:iron-sulfur cluster protein
MLNGLTQINLELTSRCDKNVKCHFCGHQDPSVHPTLTFGDMDDGLRRGLGNELEGVGQSLVVQFHRDGDPLAYLGDLAAALRSFRRNIRSVVTHGERLAERAEDLIEYCESVCVSIFRADPDREVQLTALRDFLKLKGEKLPRVFLKVVGDMTDEELAEYSQLQVPIVRRLIHVPTGNNKYAHRVPTMPEHGLCEDLLHHPSVAWDGRVFLCNRLDTNDLGLIGNLYEESLDAIWNGKLRAEYIQKHIEGRRKDVPPCKDCLYYGVPS